MKKIWIILCFLLLPEVSAAFTENTSVPTQNNTPIPINSSSSTQVKTGALVSDSYMQADVFYDRYNSGYYLQPRATNRLNYVVADNTLTYGNSITNGEVQGAFFRDRNDGNFYVDPNGTSRVNYVLSNNTYTYGTGNYADIFIRASGQWLSQVRSVNTWANAGWYQYRHDGRTDGPWCKFINLNTANCSCPSGSYVVGQYADSTFNQWHQNVYCRYY